MFTINSLQHAACGECGKLRSGVRFCLVAKQNTEAFLCWKHFRKTLKAMSEARMLEARHSLAMIETQQEPTQMIRDKSRAVGVSNPARGYGKSVGECITAKERAEREERTQKMQQSWGRSSDKPQNEEPV